jgi:hypothetical protein
MRVYAPMIANGLMKSDAAAILLYELCFSRDAAIMQRPSIWELRKGGERTGPGLRDGGGDRERSYSLWPRQGMFGPTTSHGTSHGTTHATTVPNPAY